MRVLCPGRRNRQLLRARCFQTHASSCLTPFRHILMRENVRAHLYQADADTLVELTNVMTSDNEDAPGLLRQLVALNSNLEVLPDLLALQGQLLNATVAGSSDPDVKMVKPPTPPPPIPLNYILATVSKFTRLGSFLALYSVYCTELLYCMHTPTRVD